MSDFGVGRGRPIYVRMPPVVCGNRQPDPPPDVRVVEPIRDSRMKQLKNESKWRAALKCLAAFLSFDFLEDEHPPAWSYLVGSDCDREEKSRLVRMLHHRAREEEEDLDALSRIKLTSEEENACGPDTWPLLDVDGTKDCLESKRRGKRGEIASFARDGKKTFGILDAWNGSKFSCVLAGGETIEVAFEACRLVK